MTQTARRADPPMESPITEPVPRRPLLTQLSIGHVIMVLAGLLAFLLVLALLRDRSEAALVAVAAHDIPAGASLVAEDVRMVETSADDIALIDALLSDAEVAEAIEAGRVAGASIRGGDPILATDLRAALGAEGLRAMAIELTSGRSVGGDIDVGDQVDVVVVRDGIASYVVTNVEVIDVLSSGSSVAASSDLIVTIAADGPTTLRLASALTDGEIYVVRATGASPADPLAVFDPRSGDA